MLLYIIITHTRMHARTHACMQVSSQRGWADIKLARGKDDTSADIIEKAYGGRLALKCGGTQTAPSPMGCWYMFVRTVPLVPSNILPTVVLNRFT